MNGDGKCSIVLRTSISIYYTPRLFYRRSPESMGLRPDGDVDEKDLDVTTANNDYYDSGYTWKALTKTSAFWFFNHCNYS